MYKIYINENTLSLADTKTIKSGKKSDNVLIAPYTGKTKMLLSYIDMLEKTDRFDNVILHSNSPKMLLKDFESLYQVIKASGGVVNDGRNNILFIFRRGFWDLPKGKIDAGEKKKAAAVREVSEETGISDINLIKKVHTTRHAFKKNGKRALKKTFWYSMEAPNQSLVPQTEEDISEARWVHLKEIKKLKGPMFKNIEDVVRFYEKTQLISL